MRKHVHIAVLALATAGLLLLLLLPHHHHHGVMCLVVSHCDTDQTDNDRHTGHSDDGSKCFAYVLRGVSVDNPHVHDGAEPLFFPLAAAYLGADIVWMKAKSAIPFVLRTVAFADERIAVVHGLRAPPRFSLAV